jgi:hypothetical protein
MQSLVKVLQENGAVGFENVEIGTFDIGRGLKATKEINLNEPIMSIPIQFCWKAQDIFDHSVLSKVIDGLELRADDNLAILLMYYKVTPGEHSIRDRIWKEHLQLVPQSYENSLFYTQEDLDWAKGSSLSTVTEMLGQQIVRDFEFLFINVLEKYPEVFPIQFVTLELYRWALCTIWSRGMDFYYANYTLRVVVPFVDLINGTQDIRQSHILDPSTGRIHILAGKQYRKEDQIFINYGKLSNSRLLRLYGFVYDFNQYDSYELYLSTSPQSPHFKEKTRLFELFGMSVETSFSLSMNDPLPGKILEYVRIQRADHNEILLLEKNQAKFANHRNELEALMAMRDAFTTMISKFHSQKDLEQGIKNSLHARNCAVVALGEVSILCKALDVVERRLLENSGEI